MSPKKPLATAPDDEALLPVFRALERCHTQVVRVSSRHIESLGVTPPQFDVIATLGDLAGLSCSELGERTLITRGTLFPVLDRLEAKGLVRRLKSTQDARQTLVSLTDEGQALYERIFHPHIDYMLPFFDGLSASEQSQLVGLLEKLTLSIKTKMIQRTGVEKSQPTA